MVEFYYTVAKSDLRPAYAEFIPKDIALMVPASSYALNMDEPAIPQGLTRTAADCGGFVATFKWGDYRYTPDQYVDWLETWRPTWAATMDKCCEPEVGGVVRERQEWTTDMAYHLWHFYRDTKWTWVPTVQGWEVEDYRRHARQLAPLINEMRTHYAGAEFRVGIGTLCRRASVKMIHEVVNVVANELPGVPLHLWGVKLGALQSKQGLPKQVVSVDSGAWNGMFGKGIEVARAERKAKGLTKAKHTWTLLLPRYQAKVDAALNHPYDERQTQKVQKAKRTRSEKHRAKQQAHGQLSLFDWAAEVA